MASSFTIIRPQDDAVSQQCAVWAGDFSANAGSAGHSLGTDLDGAYTTADRAAVLAAARQPADLLLYFGHGDTDCWLTANQPTIDSANANALTGKAVVSIACKTSCVLAGAAITGGATAWLGFTVRFPVLAPYQTVDPIGDALVRALAALTNGQTMQWARHQVAAEFDTLADDFDTGCLAGRPDAVVGYYASLAVRDHVVVHGNVAVTPLI